jgi:hypothetical protein
VGVVRPNEGAWLLGLISGDQDELRKSAYVLRKLASDVLDHCNDTKAEIEQRLHYRTIRCSALRKSDRDLGTGVLFGQ